MTENRLRYLERPLAELPREQAAAFVTRLYSPGGRFDRAFHYYWREVLGEDEQLARKHTLDELEESKQHLLDNLKDPLFHTLGDVGSNGYEPLALFGLRPLENHSSGALLAEAIKLSELRFEYAAPLGIAHAVAMLDDRGSMMMLKQIFVSITRKALIDGYTRVLFFSSDHRLKGIYKRFGMKFPATLAFPNSRHLVGSVDPWAPEIAEQVRRATSQHEQLVLRLEKGGSDE